MGDIALPGIGHAQSAVNKELDCRVGVVVNRFNLLQVQLARQHNLAETDVGEEFCLLDAADVTLGAGVEFNRRNIQLHHPHILHDQRINAGFIQVGNQSLRRFQLIIVQDRIQRHKDFRAVAMGERHQPGDIAEAVAGVVACAETRPADINRVCAV